ncbi:MAG: dihydropyrimidinase [Elusimicrobia bacterium]|nr:dihydropyrimidinase [Elusimicrobiota bacterium]
MTSPPYDLVVRGGTVATAAGRFVADVGVRGERVAALGDLGAPPAGAKVVDARGMIVVPGGIDAHTHLDMPFGGSTTADDFATGSEAALFGGTTTIIDFATPRRGEPLRKGLEAWRRKAEGRCSVDYGFHMVMTGAADKALREMDQLVREGVTTFKLFMAYPDRLMADDRTILRALLRTKENGGLVCMHAENGWAVETLVREALARGDTQPSFHPLTRPVAVEAEATARACMLAEVAGVPIYIMHLTSARALEEVRRARERGVAVLAETCPQYLYLHADRYDGPGAEAAKFVLSPPLRPKGDDEALWRGLREGSLQVVSTDHCSFFLKPRPSRPCKEPGRRDFSRIPNGAPGIETRMLLMWDAVQKGRLSLERFVEVTATGPARLFGLFPRKGHLSPGADADIVVIDPRKPHTITAAQHHMSVDYNPYEGKTIHGSIREVFLRGRPMVRHERFLGRPGEGRFLRRAPI